MSWNRMRHQKNSQNKISSKNRRFMQFGVYYQIAWICATILIHVWSKSDFSVRSYRRSNINCCKFSEFEIPIFSVVKKIKFSVEHIFRFWHRIWTELILGIFLNYHTHNLDAWVPSYRHLKKKSSNSKWVDVISLKRYILLKILKNCEKNSVLPQQAKFSKSIYISSVR